MYRFSCASLFALIALACLSAILRAEESAAIDSVPRETSPPESTAATSPAQELPQVVSRYEQLLIRSPKAGPAFERVYQHFLENDGLEALDERWASRLKPLEPKLPEPPETSEPRSEQAPEPSQSTKRKAEDSVQSERVEASALYLLRGMLAERRGSNDRALEFFTQATRLDPDNHRNWSAKGQHLIARGKLDEAIVALRRSLDLEPPELDRPELYKKLARAQQRQLDAEGALTTWLKMIEAFPDDAFAIEEAAEALLNAGRLEEAREAYQKLAKLSGDDPYQRVTLAMRLAEIDEREDKYDKAIARYEAMLAETTGWMNTHLRAQIEDIYRRRDDLPGLVAYYERRLKEAPDDVASLLQLSQVLIELNRCDDGIAALEKAVGLAPNRFDLKLALATRYRQEQRLSQASELLEQLATEVSDQPTLWEMLGETQWGMFEQHQDEKYREAALRSWQKIAPENTASARLVVTLAEVYRRHKLVDLATEQYRIALEIDPANNDVRERLAFFLAEQKQAEESRRVLLGMVAEDRAIPKNFIRLAKLLRRADELEKARSVLEEGLERAPDNFELLSLKWTLLTDANEWQAASGLFERLLKSAPNEYFADEVENRQIMVLRRLEKLDDFRDRVGRKILRGEDVERDELRLLIRAAISSRAKDLARSALDYGTKHFPDAIRLARLEVRFQRAMGELPGLVEALRRLIVLEPKRSAEWLRMIAVAYRDNKQFDKALEVAREAIEQSPANAEVYLLYADLCFASGNEQGAIERLRQAIQFSSRPNDVRLRLARYYSDNGQSMEALQVYEEAFEAEEDPAARLALMKPLTEAYFMAGRSAELIERFRRRQKAERDGWRYAQYLAEIFAQMRDYTNARKELSRALAGRPNDAQLLRQLVRLAEAEGNPQEQLRFQRLLTNAEPSIDNKIALTNALLATGDHEEALRIIRDEQSLLLKRPDALREMANLASDSEFTRQLSELFRSSLSAQTDSWPGLLVLAEFYLSAREFEKASDIFWKIISLPDPASGTAVPAPSLIPSAGNSLSVLYANPLADRLNESFRLRDTVLRTLSSNTPANVVQMRFNPQSFNMSQSTAPAVQNSLDSARDTSLMYLAILAEGDNEEGAFLARLRKTLQERGATTSEELISLALVEAVDPLLDRIEHYLAEEPMVEEIDAFCASYLPRLGNPESGIDRSERVSTLLEKVYTRLAKARPDSAMHVGMMHFNLLRRSGREDEAIALANKALDGFSSSHPGELRMAFDLALQSGDIDRAADFFEQMRAQQQSTSPGQVHLSNALAFALAREWLRENKNVERALGLLLEVLAQTYQPAAVVGGTAGSSGQTRFQRFRYRSLAQQINSDIGPPPATNAFFDVGQRQLIQQVAHLVSEQREHLPSLLTLMKQQASKLPKDDQIYPAVAAVYLLWWNNRQELAVEQLRSLAKRQIELQPMLAGMLSARGSNKEAIALLQSIPPEAGSVYLVSRFQLLRLARHQPSDKLLKEVAAELTKANVPKGLKGLLNAEFQQAGLGERVSIVMSRQPLTPKTPRNRLHALQNDLSESASEGDAEKAVAIAKRILAENPLVHGRTGMEHLRRQALKTLERNEKLDSYIKELEGHLKETPRSVRYLLMLAEAHTQDDPDKATEYYEQVAELRPHDFQMQRDLAERLYRGRKYQRAVEIYNRLLRGDPVATLTQGYHHVIRAYQQADKLDELTQTILDLGDKVRPVLSARGPMANVFLQLGNELRDKGELDRAVEVWSRGVEVCGETSHSLGREVINGLVDLQRYDEALAAMEDLLFPQRQAPGDLFVLSQNRPRGTPFLLRQISLQDTTRNSPILELVDLARRARGLDRLVTRAKEVVTDHRNDPWPRALLLLLRAESRDASLLQDGVDLVFDDDADSSRSGLLLTRANILRLIASRLEGWAEATDLALQLLSRSIEFYDRDENAIFHRVGARLDLALMAVDSGREDVAREALKEAAELLSEQAVTNVNAMAIESLAEVADLMLRLNMLDGAKELIALAEQSPQYRANQHTRGLFEPLQREVELAAGVIPFPRTVAWVVPKSPSALTTGATANTAGTASDKPDATTSSEAETTRTAPPKKEAEDSGDVRARLSIPEPREHIVAYEIGAGEGDEALSLDNRNVYVSGRDVPSIDRRFDVELLAGPSPTSMVRLARIPQSRSRGVWEGQLPPDARFVTTILRDRSRNGIVYFGSTLPVAIGPNLVRNPTLDPALGPGEQKPGVVPGWPQFPGLRTRIVKGGPARTESVATILSTGSDQEKRYVSAPIPLEQAKEYLQSAWFRFDQESDAVRFGCRFYDEKGDRISERWVSVTNKGVRRNWQWYGKVFGRTPSRRGNHDEIPRQAKSASLVLGVRGGCRVSGLYFGELVPENNGQARAE